MAENSSGQNGSLRWVITTLIAVFAGAGADRLVVESRLSSMNEQLRATQSMLIEHGKEFQAVMDKLAFIRDRQIDNEGKIERLQKDFDKIR